MEKFWDFVFKFPPIGQFLIMAVVVVIVTLAVAFPIATLIHSLEDDFSDRLDAYDHAVTVCLDTERYTEDICRELARVEVWGR